MRSSWFCLWWTLALFGQAGRAGAAPRAAEPLGVVEYQSPTGERLTLYKRSFAVVIGIDRYETLPPLGGAVRDARQMADFLRASGFHVTLLVDKAATRQAMTQLLGDELPAQLGADDRVVIYFAGHGLSRGVDEAAMGYLMPVESKREAPASTAISMAELQRWFATYPARHVLYMADACYSGLAIGTRAAGLPTSMRDYLREVTKRQVRAALVAGASGQEAHEFRGNGLFTSFVLSGLRGAADANKDGLVTTDELAAYVKPNVAQVAAAQFHAQQHPQMGRSGEGEFLFLVPGAMPAAPELPAPSVFAKPAAVPIGALSGPFGQPIGVLDVEVEGAASLQMLAKPLTVLVTDELARDPNLQVLPRQTVRRAVSEVTTATGLSGAPAVGELARVSQAQTLVVGRLREAGDLVHVELEAIAADGHRVAPAVQIVAPAEAAQFIAHALVEKLRNGLNLPVLASTDAQPMTRPELVERAKAIDGADQATTAPLPTDSTPTHATLVVQCRAPGAKIAWAKVNTPSPAVLLLPPGPQRVVCKAPDYVDTPRQVDAAAGVERYIVVDMVTAATTIRRDLDTTMQVRAGLGYFLVPRLSLVGSDPVHGIVHYTRHDTEGPTDQTHFADLVVDNVRAAANPMALALDWSFTGRGFGFAFGFDYLRSDAQIGAKVSEDPKDLTLDARNYEIGDLQAGLPATLTNLRAKMLTFDFVFRHSIGRVQLEGRAGTAFSSLNQTLQFTLGKVANTLEISQYTFAVPLKVGAALFMTDHWMLYAHYHYTLLADNRRGVVVGLGWAP